MSPKKYVATLLAAVIVLALLVLGVLPAQAAAPANDDISYATQIFGLPFSDTIDTTEATSASDDPFSECNWYTTPGASVWYQFTPTTSEAVIVSTMGSDYETIVGVFSGSPGALTTIDCRSYFEPDIVFNATAGENYYLMVAAISSGPYPDPTTGVQGGWLNFSLRALSDPVADFYYSNAPEFDLHAVYFNNWSYDPDCYYCYLAADWDFGDGTTSTEWSPIHTYPADGSYLVKLTVTTEDGRSAQTEQYVDVVTPPPSANFYYSPYEPSIYDTVYFNYWECYWCSVQWDFGDGATSTAMDAYHRYAADGDYTVSLTVTAPDGQTATQSQQIQVRTYDVAILRFIVPQSAKAGQTRSVSVEISNTTQPVEVEVSLYKSNGQNWDWVGSLQQSVEVRPANRTTTFDFSYTFTSADADLGTLNFQAVANLPFHRDAIPTNNEAISLPTKVRR